ncbi:Arylsulfatase [Rosistilla oblonga]|uniref:sulfatase n=1 Tax=Rosistilla oblonga TaxID=2527990 RepID=UPI0011889474|nr:sulfatase [Rosistilla oblonga]QDV13227.1 Arylsulfatase [Rosistilla oblonga]
MSVFAAPCVYGLNDSIDNRTITMKATSLFLLSMLLIFFSSPAQATEAHQPNIVFILVDDLGWSDLHCYGHRYHHTPHLDRLAAEGLRFTAGYSPAPICSAARASILTGKTVARLGFEFVTKNTPGRQSLDIDVPLLTPELTLNLPAAEVTIAERLAAVGYQTAFFGKWHVSQHYQRRYLAWHPDFGPKQQGFAVAGEDFGDHPYAWDKKHPPSPAPGGVFPRDSMIQRTADFIRRQADATKPYFLMASSFYVHTPVKTRCRWLVEKYERHLPPDAKHRRQRLEYAAFVETLDHHVGTILDAIDQSGRRENTLVFFMSDNGGHPEYCANAPLRGSKWNLYEGGIRIPMIARWPGKIDAGVTSDTPVIGYDLSPTFVSLAGGDARGMDGIDMQRVLREPSWKPNRHLLWHFPYYHPEKTFSKAIDKIGVDDFTTSKTRPQSALRKGNYKLIHFAEDDRVELYDVAADISEANDLSQSHAEIAAQLRETLQQQLDAMNARRAVARE